MKLSFALVFCLLQISWCEMDKTWWKYTTIYQVFLPSFKDSNGDGTGDLKGLISKLDHFVDIGVETIYITPHYESPMVDSGYDIKNYTSVNPLMGTMEDFELLIEEMNFRGKVEKLLNYAFESSEYFSQHEKILGHAFIFLAFQLLAIFYVSVFDGSAWTWNNERKQFYYHQFTSQQPDLNFRDEALKIELKKVFKFWLDKGVAGFRLDAVRHFLEDAEFRDEPIASPDIKVPHKYHDLNHTYTSNIPDTYEFLYKLRKYFNTLSKKVKDFERILVSEDYNTDEKLIRYYGSEKHEIMHLPLNFIFAKQMVHYENASFYHKIIGDYLNSVPKWATPTWNAENHDKLRKSFVLNEEFEFISAALVMMLPGMAYIYYGQEIGVTGAKIRPDQWVNSFFDDITQTSRDYFRLPMPWDDSLNGGFSTNRNLYLPLNPNYWRINVETEKNQKHSYYHMFKKMAKLRKTKTFMHGDFKSYVISTWVYAFSRTFEQEASLVIINFGSETEFIDLRNAIGNLPEFLIVQVASPNSGYKIGGKIPTEQKISKIFILRPFAVLVLSIGRKCSW